MKHATFQTCDHSFSGSFDLAEEVELAVEMRGKYNFLGLEDLRNYWKISKN